MEEIQNIIQKSPICIQDDSPDGTCRYCGSNNGNKHNASQKSSGFVSHLLSQKCCQSQCQEGLDRNRHYYIQQCIFGCVSDIGILEHFFIVIKPYKLWSIHNIIICKTEKSRHENRHNTKNQNQYKTGKNVNHSLYCLFRFSRHIVLLI